MLRVYRPKPPPRETAARSKNAATFRRSSRRTHRDPAGHAYTIPLWPRLAGQPAAPLVLPASA
jgi:hypothetical protein